MLVAALGLAAADAGAQVYRWVDDDGNAHYVGNRDEVPERFRPQLPSDDTLVPPGPDPDRSVTPSPPRPRRARVWDECVLRIAGRAPRTGSSARSYASCEACRKALEALPRDEAARATCVLVPE